MATQAALRRALCVTAAVVMAYAGAVVAQVGPPAPPTDGVIQVFLVPHSHDDVSAVWRKLARRAQHASCAWHVGVRAWLACGARCACFRVFSDTTTTTTITTTTSSTTTTTSSTCTASAAHTWARLTTGRPAGNGPSISTTTRRSSGCTPL